MKQLISIAFTLLFILPNAFSQTQDLQKGVLIIFLQSNNNKITALEEVLKKSPGNKNLRRQLDYTRAETKRTNEAVMRGFEETYNFSEVLFTYDYHIKDLKAGKKTAIFLNKSLEIDKNLSAAGRFLVILKNGTSISGAEGYQILNAELTPFPEPFPQFVRLNTLSYLVNTIFADDIALGKLYGRLAKKVQKRFEGFALRGR